MQVAVLVLSFITHATGTCQIKQCKLRCSFCQLIPTPPRIFNLVWSLIYKYGSRHIVHKMGVVQGEVYAVDYMWFQFNYSLIY